MVEGLFSKYIGRKFLVFIVGTIVFLFAEKFSDMHWVYLAGIYLTSNVIARVRESSFTLKKESSWLTRIIARYFGRKFLVFLIGTILFVTKDKFTSDAWLMLAGMYCGANVVVDFMPSIGASLKAIGKKIVPTGEMEADASEK